MKRKNFPKNFPPSPNIAIHDALSIWRTVSPNGFLAGSGAAVHERERQGTESGTSDGRRSSVLLSTLVHVFSSFSCGGAFSRLLRSMASFSVFREG